MRIINQSEAIITINGSKIFPGDEFVTSENMFNTQPIYSDIGSVEITTEYGKRSFECFGNLKAHEDETRRDYYELPFIIIEGATNG